MSVVINLVLLALGIVVLIWAGDWLVRGAASLARKWGVPALIVGLTIVAFGTSAPELVVSVQAVLDGLGDLAIGNIVGSNIANILLVLGVPALIATIHTDIPGAGRNALIGLVATVMLIGLVFIANPMQWWHGAVLFAGIVAYLFYMFRMAKRGADDPMLEDIAELDEMSGMPDSIARIAGYIIVGLIGLPIGGWLIVSNASELAAAAGISEAFIGLTIVAFGTSLPELATVVIAARKGHADVAIGNVLGSNIFNIFAVGGMAGLVIPFQNKSALIEAADKAPGLPVPQDFLEFDFWVMLAALVLLSVYIFLKRSIGRMEGVIFCFLYVAYIAILIAKMQGVM